MGNEVKFDSTSYTLLSTQSHGTEMVHGLMIHLEHITFNIKAHPPFLPPSLPPSLPLTLPYNFQVENDVSKFGLFVVHDSGFQEPCNDSDCPLMVRLRLGPNEDIAKIFIMEKSHAEEMKISAEVGVM